MKLKNVNATLLILAGLLCLSVAFFATADENPNGAKNIFLDSDQDGLSDSEEKAYGTNSQNPDTDGDSYSDGAEIKAGYNPLKKAPGDKLNPDVLGKSASIETADPSISGEKENLTEKMAQKISALTSQSVSENKEVDMADIQSLLDSVMNGENFQYDLPEISKDDIKIKKQNYGALSEEKAKEKKKEDAVNYSVAVLYIFTSNSPEPLTSSTDAATVLNKTIKQILSSLSSGNSENLNGISENGKKIYEQLKAVEVPEDMVDTQIKALQYAAYSEDLKNLINLNPADPISNLSNYTKIETFVESLNSFYEEIKDKMEEYEIDYGEVQNKLDGQGIGADVFGN